MSNPGPFVKCVITKDGASVDSDTAKVNAKHRYTYYDVVDGDNAYHAYFCAGDGCTEFENGSKSKHNYGPWKVAAEATATTKGLSTPGERSTCTSMRPITALSARRAMRRPTADTMITDRS